jgi:hypothetical protein
MEDEEEASSNEYGCFAMRDSSAKVGQASRWDL